MTTIHETRFTLFVMFIVLLALLLVAARSSLAQTTAPVVPTEFHLLILPSVGDPLTLTPVQTQTTTIGPTQNCGLDPTSVGPSPAAPVVNPLLFALDDPFTPGKLCRLAFPQTLPAGSYQWAGVLVAPTCTPTPGGPPPLSPCPGPRGVGLPPFSIVDRTLPPAAPTGLRVTQ